MRITRSDRRKGYVVNHTTTRSIALSAVTIAVMAAALMLTGASLYASTDENAIYTFNNTNGSQPYGQLIADGLGNLYGTTTYGGTFSAGVVFQMSATGSHWTENLLYSFQGGSNDGSHPFSGLVMDAAGNLYGTTQTGGSFQNCSGGCGTVYELLPPSTPEGAWTETVLHNFSGSDGDSPMAGLVIDDSGNLYGTTHNAAGFNGTVFELSPPGGGNGWTLTTLHTFVGVKDGANPFGGLVLGKDNALFGATSYGGEARLGMIYELKLQEGSWKYSALYSFNGGVDGANPLSTLVLDKIGNLYGTTTGGGLGFGTVFEVTLPTLGSPLKETVLYSFHGAATGAYPVSGLVFDKSGNLFGTTSGGLEGPLYPGTVFELIPPTEPDGVWTETGLHVFANRGGGANPYAGLVFGKGGWLYGATIVGGTEDAGVLFRVEP
jgi:hypothetical protein